MVFGIGDGYGGRCGYGFGVQNSGFGASECLWRRKIFFLFLVFIICFCYCVMDNPLLLGLDINVNRNVFTFEITCS